MHSCFDELSNDSSAQSVASHHRSEDSWSSQSQRDHPESGGILKAVLQKHKGIKAIQTVLSVQPLIQHGQGCNCLSNKVHGPFWKYPERCMLGSNGQPSEEVAPPPPSTLCCLRDPVTEKEGKQPKMEIDTMRRKLINV